jgi:hypothetical protein
MQQDSAAKILSAVKRLSRQLNITADDRKEFLSQLARAARLVTPRRVRRSARLEDIRRLKGEGQSWHAIAAQVFPDYRDRSTLEQESLRRRVSAQHRAALSYERKRAGKAKAARRKGAGEAARAGEETGRLSREDARHCVFEPQP